jgi:lauroyl/myristoyl acyltransferase
MEILPNISIYHYVIVSILLFGIGVVGVMLRRNALIIFYVHRVNAECRESAYGRVLQYVGAMARPRYLSFLSWQLQQQRLSLDWPS